MKRGEFLKLVGAAGAGDRIARGNMDELFCADHSNGGVPGQWV